MWLKSQTRLKIRTSISSRLLLCIALGATITQAHVAVLPRESAAGATQKYTMRVPDEKNIPTVRMEAEFPAAFLQVLAEGSRHFRIVLWSQRLKC